jgi:hypothetical protein
MRYLLLAGPSRWSIYVSRTVAVLIASWMVLLPALVVGLAACVVLPTASQDEMSLTNVGSSVWNVALLAGTYALISMGVGSLLRSNGAAIAIALVINIGITPAIGLLSAWSETLGDLSLPQVLSELGGSDTSLPVAVAVVAFVAWLALFLGAGWVRVSRDEY